MTTHRKPPSVSGGARTLGQILSADLYDDLLSEAPRARYGFRAWVEAIHEWRRPILTAQDLAVARYCLATLDPGMLDIRARWRIVQADVPPHKIKALVEYPESPMGYIPVSLAFSLGLTDEEFTQVYETTWGPVSENRDLLTLLNANMPDELRLPALERHVQRVGRLNLRRTWQQFLPALRRGAIDRGRGVLDDREERTAARVLEATADVVSRFRLTEYQESGGLRFDLREYHKDGCTMIRRAADRGLKEDSLGPKWWRVRTGQEMPLTTEPAVLPSDDAGLAALLDAPEERLLEWLTDQVKSIGATPREQEVMALHVVAQLPVADIATRLGIEPVTVRVHISSARRRFEKRLLSR